MTLVKDVKALLDASPDVAAVVGMRAFDDFAQMAGALFSAICKSNALGDIVASTYNDDPALIETTCFDISETARRNFEPGGAAASFLFARGVHAVMAHRVAHKLWRDGNTNLSLATKAVTGRTFATDIHPAAQIGAGFWLDHGLGCVIGETAVIGEDVSIWHNVTLGSTLGDSGACRHPQIGCGVVIGAGAVLLGGIKVGALANIAAGAIVVRDVAEGALMVGSKATDRGPARISFSSDAREG